MRTLFILGVISIFFAVAPFIVYQQQLSQGVITNADDWYEQSGSNHGPWRYENAGLLMFEPQMVLFVISLLLILTEAINKRRPRIILGLVILSLLQILVFGTQLFYLGWLID